MQHKSHVKKNIGKRLRFERQRLEITVKAMAAYCLVTKQTQINYEKGNNTPDAEYLNLASIVGVDIYFVVTGNLMK